LIPWWQRPPFLSNSEEWRKLRGLGSREGRVAFAPLPLVEWPSLLSLSEEWPSAPLPN